MSNETGTRQDILDRLKEGRKTVAELSKELGISKAAVSQHLSKLQETGMVRSYVDPYFKILKYFEINSNYNIKVVEAKHVNNYLKIAVILILLVIAALASGLYFVQIHNNNQTTIGNPNNSTNGVGLNSELCMVVNDNRTVIGIIGLLALLAGTFLNLAAYAATFLRRNKVKIEIHGPSQKITLFILLLEAFTIPAIYLLNPINSGIFAILSILILIIAFIAFNVIAYLNKSTSKLIRLIQKIAFALFLIGMISIVAVIFMPFLLSIFGINPQTSVAC